MQSLKLSVIFFLLLPCLHLARAQSSPKMLDSLRLELKLASHDTVRCRILRAIVVNEQDVEKWFPYNERLKALCQSKLCRKVERKKEELTYQNYYATALHSEGYYHYFLGDLPLALKCYKKSLKIRKTIDDKIGVIRTTHNIAAIFSVQNDLKNALKYNQLSLQISRQLGSLPDIADALSNLGVVYYSSGKTKSAEDCFFEALSIYEREKSPPGIALSYANLGDLAVIEGDSDKALQHYQKALKIQESIDHDWGVASVLIQMGGLYKSQKKMNQALKCFTRSLKIGEKMQYAEYIKTSVGNLYHIHRALGDSEQALAYYTRYIEIRDKTENLEAKKAAVQLDLQYEYEKKHIADSLRAVEEKRLQAATIKHESRQKLLLGLVLILVIVVGFLLFWAARKRYTMRLREENIKSEKKVFDERHRIARELHDNIGSQLTYIISNIETIALKAEKANTNPDIKDRMERLGNYAGDAVKQLRDAVWTLNKKTITCSELQEKVEVFLTDFFGRQSAINWKLTWNCMPERILSPSQSLNIFRIIQEGTNNAYKHSGARRIEVILNEKDATLLNLQIRDNGCGFESTELRESNGMQNLRFRVNELNGSIRIESMPGKGTAVEVELPV